MATLKQAADWFRKKQRIKALPLRREPDPPDLQGIEKHLFAEEVKAEKAVADLKYLCIAKAEWIEAARARGERYSRAESELSVMWAAVQSLETMQAAFRQAIERISNQSNIKVSFLETHLRFFFEEMQIEATITETANQTIFNLAQLLNAHDSSGNIESNRKAERKRTAKPRSADAGE